MNSFEQDGWWEICQSLRPEMTREQFDASWEKFQAEKARRASVKASLRLINGDLND